VALDEDRRLLRIKPNCEQLSESQERAMPQQGGIMLDRDRVLIDHAVVRVIRILEIHPMTQGPQVIAELK